MSLTESMKGVNREHVKHLFILVNCTSCMLVFLAEHEQFPFCNAICGDATNCRMLSH